MSLDLTAAEVVRLVQIINSLPENAMMVHEDVLYRAEDHPVVKTLVEKVSDELQREDVIHYMQMMVDQEQG